MYGYLFRLSKMFTELVGQQSMKRTFLMMDEALHGFNCVEKRMCP